MEFPKPDFSYNYKVSFQIQALRDYKMTKPGRDIPEKDPNKLLLATWNIANLGVQERRSKDYRLIAEIISWFDIVALQEVNDDLSGLRAVLQHLPSAYSALFTDKSGNNERMCCVFDSNKVQITEKIGEVAVPPSQQWQIKLNGIQQKFRGFDRNPQVVAFQVGTETFLIVNAHMFFGSESPRSMNRRALETYAVGRWADLRRKSRNAYTKDIIVLGDFNLPKVEEGDPIYSALIKRGLYLPEHSTGIGSAIKTDNHYDQIAFFPGKTMERFTKRSGVFDFDGALFKTLWTKGNKEDFFSYMRYYISDHRILWAQFSL